MRTIKIVFSILFVLMFGRNVSHAQNLNWAGLRQDQRHILNVNAGFDYAFTYGIGYGYQLKTKMPIVLNIEHSQPVGKNVFDDFKTKIGAQVKLLQYRDIHFTAKVQGIARRFENDYVRQFNFGSELAGTVGYYKSGWYVAGEVGFDKAIVTNFKHSSAYKENFPDVKNGWYQPAAGGNFYYGLQTGISFTSSDVTLKAGKVVEQDFKTSAMVPFYFQVGYNKRF